MMHRLFIVAVFLVGCADTAAPPAPVEPSAISAAASLSAEQRQAVAALVELTAERLQLMPGVALYKWNHKLPIENKDRENELLGQLVAQGKSAGVSEEIIAPFFERQFAAAKDLQQRFFEVWEGDTNAALEEGPDLATEIRPEIDRISTEMIAQLAILEAVWEQAELRQSFRDAIGRFESKRAVDEDAEDEELIDAVWKALTMESHEAM